MSIRTVNGLTPKQNKLVNIVVQQIKETGETNLAQAGLKVYETDNAHSASVMAGDQLQNIDVKKRIQELLEDNGLTTNKIASNIAFIGNQRDFKVTEQGVLRANEIALKYLAPTNNVSTNINITGRLKDLNYNDLKGSLEKVRGKNNELVEDIK